MTPHDDPDEREAIIAADSHKGPVPDFPGTFEQPRTVVQALLRQYPDVKPSISQESLIGRMMTAHARKVGA